MKRKLLFFSCSLLLYCSNSLAKTNITGNVSLDGTNSGTIVSVGGAEFSLDLSVAKIGVSVGDSQNTITNINTIIINGNSSVHDVSLKANNTGKIINVGSKLNLNTIIIGQ